MMRPTKRHVVFLINVKIAPIMPHILISISVLLLPIFDANYPENIVTIAAINKGKEFAILV